MSVVVTSLWDELRVLVCLNKVLTSKNKEEKETQGQKTEVSKCVCFSNSVAKIRVWGSLQDIFNQFTVNMKYLLQLILLLLFNLFPNKTEKSRVGLECF